MVKIYAKNKELAHSDGEKLIWEDKEVEQLMNEEMEGMFIEHEVTDTGFDNIVEVEPSLNQILFFLKDLGFEII